MPRKRQLTDEQQKIIDRCLAERDRLVESLHQAGYDCFFKMGELDVENMALIPHAYLESYYKQRQLKTFKQSSARSLANIKDNPYDISLRAFIEGHMRARADDEEERESRGE